MDFFRGCVICGAQRTHEHHIVKRKLGGVETISLCPKHHIWADRGRISEELLWSLRHDRAVGSELTDDWGIPWEIDYHRDLVYAAEAQFHDFYSEEYAICMYPPSLDPDNHHIYRQCMISLWFGGKRSLDFSTLSSPERKLSKTKVMDEPLVT